MATDATEKDEKRKMRKARYYQAHKDEVLARNKKWREGHKEHVREYQRAYQSDETNKARRRQRIRERMATEPAYREKTRECKREWDAAKRASLEADPEELEAFLAKKRALAKAAYERERQRMADDPAFAEQVRAKRHAKYLRRRARNVQIVDSSERTNDDTH